MTIDTLLGVLRGETQPACQLAERLGKLLGNIFPTDESFAAAEALLAGLETAPHVVVRAACARGLAELNWRADDPIGAVYFNSGLVARVAARLLAALDRETDRGPRIEIIAALGHHGNVLPEATRAALARCAAGADREEAAAAQAALAWLDG